MNFRPFFALVAFALSACAGVGQDGRSYPSLARRPIEEQGEEGASVAEEATALAVTDDADLKQKLAVLSGQTEKGAAKFDALFQKLSGSIRVSASAPVSSEQWVAAYQSLGRLEQARYDSVSALASLDMLYSQRMKDVADGAVSGGVEEVGAVRDNALSVVDSQNDRVDRLRAVLKQPE